MGFFPIQLCYFKLILLVEDRQRGRFAGFSIFVSNTGGIEVSKLCYMDGPQLPPLNFTTTCTEHMYGRYVIFYNERKAGVDYPDGYQLSTAYTELCEVIVKGILFVLQVISSLFLTFMQTVFILIYFLQIKIIL